MYMAICGICGDVIKLLSKPQSEAYCIECVQRAIDNEKSRVAARLQTMISPKEVV